MSNEALNFCPYCHDQFPSPLGAFEHRAICQLKPEADKVKGIASTRRQKLMRELDAAHAESWWRPEAAQERAIDALLDFVAIPEVTNRFEALRKPAYKPEKETE